MKKNFNFLAKILTVSVFAFAAILFVPKVTLAGSPYTPGAFVTTWDTAKPGTDGNTEITIPVQGNTNNYNVDWGDGTTDTGDTTYAQHTYLTPGVYTVTMTGSFGYIAFGGPYGGDPQKIIAIDQWGTNVWTSMSDAFYGCTNLVVNATDAPNLGSVTDASYMFWGTTSFNQDISSWDVSKIANMKNMFGDSAFDQPLNSWNVSSVTDMSGMFEFNSVFNQPLNSWNVSSVTDMSGMFQGDSVFNQPLNSWNVSNVTNMYNMFQAATAFNQPLNSWNVSSVTNMQVMFGGATSFDQDISSWNVSKVTSMQNMFNNNAGLSTAHYDALLAAWSGLSLKSSVIFDAGSSKYCNSATQRQNIINNFGWTINDSGNGCTYTLTYTAGPHGTVTGSSPQTVMYGNSGTAVTASPDAGYTFVNWSDNNNTNPRTDGNVSGNISVTANFALKTTKPKLTSLPPASVTQTSAVLGGDITSDGNTPITNEGVYYFLAADEVQTFSGQLPPHVATVASGSLGVGNFTVSANDLTCNTIYDGLAFAVNSVGQQVASANGQPDIVTFTTSPCGSGASAAPVRIISGGGQGYVCTDPKASNYDTYPASGNTACSYSTGTGLGGGGSTGSATAISTAELIGSGTCPANLLITDNLKVGAKDGQYNAYNKGTITQVTTLQKQLNRILAASYHQAAGPTDGIFGPLTKQGVERLQMALNTILKPTPLLKVDGVVGAFTKAAINNSCGNGN